MYLHPHTHRLFRQFDAHNRQAATPAWEPRVDIREDASAFTLLIDIPGIDPHSIDIQAEAKRLLIAGERSAAALAEGEQLSRAERPQGKFERRFALPETADTDAITALGQYGVLQVRIPKKAQVQPRKIQVGVTALDEATPSVQ